MKKCNNCNLEYEDSKMFCSQCGGPLIPVVPSAGMTQQPQNSYAQQPQGSYAQQSQGSYAQQDPNTWTAPGQEAPQQNQQMPEIMQNWGGLILGVVGIIVCWCISWLIGLAIAAVGVYLGWRSPNQINKYGSVACEVLVVLLRLL
jgi:hypothetical protein